MRLGITQLSFCVSHGIPIASAGDYSSNTEQNLHASPIDNQSHEPAIHAAAIGICVPAGPTYGSNFVRPRAC